MRLATGLACLALGACSMPDGDALLDELDLTQSEREVANAVVEGLRGEMAVPMLRKRDYYYAACYAKAVDMPASYRNAHLAYISNYTEADEDYYGFFAGYGLDEEQAYSVFERYETANGKCTPAGIREQLEQADG
ncbi:hypothetical protein [Erythrobacter alti]|uniref:hypothetical protein n=1 Tax=Erythrobacter alti TaxID=1896145 RepID=UPI0030F47CEB